MTRTADPRGRPSANRAGREIAEHRVADASPHQAAAVHSPQESIVGIRSDSHRGRVATDIGDSRRLAIRFAGDNQPVQLLDRWPESRNSHGQPIEQRRMRRQRAHAAKIVRRVDQSAAEMILPHPIDDRTPSERIAADRSANGPAPRGVRLHRRDASSLKRDSMPAMHEEHPARRPPRLRISPRCSTSTGRRPCGGRCPPSASKSLAAAYTCDCSGAPRGLRRLATAVESAPPQSARHQCAAGSVFEQCANTSLGSTSASPPQCGRSPKSSSGQSSAAGRAIVSTRS